MRELIIDNYKISDESDAYIICEIGNTHNGDMKTARDLITSAKERGANAVKLQKKDVKNVFTKRMLATPYDSPFGKTYGEHKEALEFNENQFRELQEYANKIDITFFATPFDITSAVFLQSIDIPCFKIASAHITDIELIKYCISTNKPVIISTGASKLEDIERVYNYCKLAPVLAFPARVYMTNPFQLAFLHCICIYPTPREKTNLRVIRELKKAFPDIIIGYSNHSEGSIGKDICEDAYHYGANIIEVHYTLSREQKGTDHKISLEPEELEQLAISLKDARALRGTGQKEILEEEKGALKKMAKSIWPVRALPKGQVLRPEDIAIKIPNDGMPVYRLDEVIGKTLICDCSTADVLTEDKLND